jgi:UDP-glucose 4-epimerase
MNVNILKSKYLILGGAGFIGTNLIERLLQDRETDITVVDKFTYGNKLLDAGFSIDTHNFDITDVKKLGDLIRSKQPTHVIHLAANSNIQISSGGANSDITDTFGTTVALASCLARNPVENVFFASTGAIYGVSNKPVSEDSPKLPISPYGWMKLASEEVLMQSLNAGDCKNLLVARFPNVTGKWTTHGVVLDLATKLFLDKSHLSVLGDGNQTKPYCSASSLSEAIQTLIDGTNKTWSRQLVVNLSPNDSITVKEIVEILCQEFDVSPQISYGESSSGWIGDVPQYSYDTKLSIEHLKGFVFPESKLAILDAVRWVKQQRELN